MAVALALLLLAVVFIGFMVLLHLWFKSQQRMIDEVFEAELRYQREVFRILQRRS